MDKHFVDHHNILTTVVSPIGLYLFDGTYNSIITQAAEILILFLTGITLVIKFFVTSLNSSCSAALGYNWLRQHNLLIDWSTGHILFRSAEYGGPAPLTSPSEAEILPGPSEHLLNFDQKPAEDPTPVSATPSISPPPISLINASAYMHASQLPGSLVFQLSLTKESALRNTMHTAPSVDLSNVPKKYHEFADVFNKKKANTLPPHHSYDLKIELEEGASPPPGHMYSLSPMKLEALCTFIDENLNNGFIHPSKSPHRAPILFVKKKSKGLQLCLDYHSINRLSKKDRYPLPLLADLDAPKKAHMYTKIDLCHAYHLVCIADGEEWKTTFCTCYGSYE